MNFSTPFKIALLASYTISTAQANTSDDDISNLLESLTLEDLINMTVSTVSLKEEIVSDAPGIVSVITKHDIANYQADNLTDLLSRLPGVAHISTGRFHNNQLGFRGQEYTQHGTHVLYLLNGRPARDALTGGIMAPLLNGIPLSAIEQIEVIRGPGSVLYGSNAFAGVVNIKTTKASQDSSNTWLHLKAASFGTYGAEGGLNFSHNDFNGTIALKHRDSDGENYNYSDRTGVVLSPDWFEKDTGVVADLSYKGLSTKVASFKRDAFSIQAGFRWQELNIDRHTHDIFDLSYKTDVFDNHKFYIFYTKNKFTRKDGASDAFIAKSDIAELRLSGNISESIDYVVGLLREKVKNLAAGDFIQASERVGNSFYWQSSYRPLDDLKLIAGLQWNKTEVLSGEVSPRLGAIYYANNNLSIKALYGEAFRSGTPFDMDLSSSLLAPNPNLAPETVKTTDLSVNYAKGNWTASATYFHSELDDLFVRSRIEGNQFQVVNGEGWIYDGLELEGKINLDNGIHLFANASWQRNEDKSTGEKDAAAFPAFMIKAGSSYKTEYTVSSMYVGYFDAPPLTSDEAINPSPDDYIMLSASITVDIPEISDNAQFKISGDNLLDESIYYSEFHRFAVHSVRLHSGRSFSVSLNLAY